LSREREERLVLFIDNKGIVVVVVVGTVTNVDAVVILFVS